jgi:ligand-binding sensor domain-containing protein/signal transduction histidine kinase
LARSKTILGAFWLLAAPLLADQPIMRLFTTDDGLARNWITHIRRDSHGRLWFCTVEGLSLYDGQSFANYGVKDGLPHRMVYDILEAGGGYYWLATGAGLTRFRPRTAKGPAFEPVPASNKLQALESAELLRTRAGEIWYGTDKGLYLLRSGPRPEAIAVDIGPAGAPIKAMAEGPDGSLWLAMAKSIARRRPDGSISFLKVDYGLNPSVRALLIDRDGILWAGGLGLYTLDSRQASPVLRPYRYPTARSMGGIQSLYQDSQGRIWIGGSGVVRGEARGPHAPDLRLQYFDRNSPLGSQYAFAFCEDSAGNLWIALGALGAARVLKPGFSQFNEADGLESKIVQSVFETRQGALLAVSGARHTLNQFDGSRFTPIQPLAPRINSFGWGEDKVELEDRRGEWWVATGMGLLHYPKVARPADLGHTPPKAVYLRADGLPDDGVTRLFEDSRGDIWVGTGSGVARFRAETGALENLTAPFQAALGHEPIPHSFAEDRNGGLWAGFYEDGLVRYRGGRAEKIRGAPAGSINGLLVDHAGRLWVASSQQGLARIDDPTDPVPAIRRFTEADGVRGQHLFALAEDRTGRIYIAGGYGVDRLDPTTGFAFHFAANGGLPEGETHRLFCDRQGDIWFASDFGLSRYVPEPDSTVSPAVPSIHEFRVSGVTALQSEEGESQVAVPRIPAGKDSIEITYGSVDFAVGNNLRYRYRLWPAEYEWRAPTAARTVLYAGINPGSYRFDVQAVGPTGLPSAGMASAAFRIAPPFWKTWWFAAFAGLSIAALVLAAHLYRVQHLLSVERIRVHLAADLHDNLGAGLTEIAILTEVAKQQKNTHSLEDVANRARELRSAMGDIVWSVDPECDDLDGLIRRWRQTAFTLVGNESLEFLAPPDAETARVPLRPDCRRHLLLLFKEVLSNVARHSHAAHVRVEVGFSHDSLALDVVDDGSGFDPAQPHSGNGLKNMALRAEAVRAALQIESLPGKGTRVRVRAPL